MAQVDLLHFRQKDVGDMPQRLAAVRTVIYPASATPGRVAVYCDRKFGRNKLRTSRMESRHLGGARPSMERRSYHGGARRLAEPPAPPPSYSDCQRAVCVTVTGWPAESTISNSKEKI